MITERQQVLKCPMFAQPDLRNILIAAGRLLEVSPRPRGLSRAELQLLALCGVIRQIIRGQLGDDLEGEPVGDLTLRAQPYVPVYQPKLGENGN